MNQLSLPQLSGDLFLTDGGLETTLIFHNGIDLPQFAAFDLLKDDAGERVLRDYYAPYLDLARQHGLGFILESATWRANPDWAAALGYGIEQLDELNRKSIALLRGIRDAEIGIAQLVISGCVGPRDDGYNPASVMTAEDAEAYHARQIRIYAEEGAQMVSAITMTNIPEAVGVTRAAQTVRMPVVISFTVETDGTLPTGESLRQAIEAVDAATDEGPAYYMINCAHPSHFADVLEDGAWMQRIHGIRANASNASHAELDEAEELDAGDPEALGQDYRALRTRFPQINVLGGCCGTDHRHLAAICAACMD
jgi:S-methylmethionine-dependent homocysteine/selenocysteine methylase